MKKKDIKYLIWGYYGFGNLGDDLMLKVVVGRIRDVYPNASIYVIGESTPSIANILPVNLKKNLINLPIITSVVYLWRLLAVVLKVDKLIIGGGTLFLDRGQHNPSMMLLTVAVFLRKIFFKKSYITGIGIDKLTRSINKWYLRRILDNSETVAVRDNFSYNATNSSARRSNIIKASDILFDSRFVQSLKEVIIFNRKYITLVLCDYNRMARSVAERKIFKERCLEFITTIIKKWGGEFKIALCAFQYNKGDRDHEFLTELRDDIVKEQPFFSDKIIVEYVHSEDQLKEYIGRAIFVVSNRYHALVFSAILGVPFMGIQVEMKIGDICDKFKMPFIKESDYVADGIDLNNLAKLIGMRVSEDALNQSVEQAKGNFLWIK